jgi:Protein kinase domain
MKICLECEGISDTQREHCASCGIRLSDTSAVHFPLRRGEADAANPLLGAVIDGKYQVQGVLGKGGMGTVFRAVHQVSLIPVALKILNPRFSVRAEYREYFLEEAQKAGRVTHEHAGRILDVGEAEDGTVYIAMEEVHGTTLHECIHGDELLPPAIVVDILDQICQALAAAHHAGLVHRDLSPRNVMVVVRNGLPFVKILDFGIAKGLPHASSIELKDTEVSLAPRGFASPPYSAPEHLEGKDVDARADLYSLGVIAYEALTQDLPVAGDTPQERAEATLRGEVQPLPAIPGVPAKLVRLIRSLMSIDPNERPGSAEDVRLALRSISQPDSRMLRDVAVLVLFFAVVVCGFAYSFVDEPILAKRFGVLRVGATADEVPAVQYVRSEQLAVMHFEYSGFAPGDLVAEVARRGEILSVDALGARVARGHLVLDRDGSPEYSNFLALLVCRCRGGPVMITLQLRGGVALGVANVLVDDTSPALTLRHIGTGSAGVINEASELAIRCEDHGELSRLRLECREGDRQLEPIDLESRFGAGPLLTVRAATLLRPLQPSPVPLHDVTVTLVATDRAGNQARRALDGSFDVDFALPIVLGRRDVSATFVDQEQASLSFEFDAPDAGLSMGLRDRDDTPFVDLKFDPTVDNQMKVYLARRDAPADLEFQLRDRAGNRTTFTRRVTFYPRTADLGLLGRPQKELAPLGEAGLVWTGAKVEFEFRCNPFYKPVDVSLSDRSLGLKLLTSRSGQGLVRLPALGGSERRLQLLVTLEPNTRNPVRTVATWDVWVLPVPLRLELPDTSAMRFFSQVTSDDGLFEEPNGGTIEQRPWRLQPPDHRLLRGKIGWASGRPEVPDELPLPVCTDPDEPFFRRLRPRRGTNVVYLLLRDVFGREVEVSIGGAVANKLESGPLRGAVRIAEFQFHPEVAQVQVDALKLEYQQPTRVIFHSDYTFDAGDQKDIAMIFQANRVPCVQLRPQSGGTDLIFDLSYGEIASASGLRLDDDKLKMAGHRFAIKAGLRTPAGDQEFTDDRQIQVETTRSSLVQVRLGKRFADLGPVLGAIEMVPVLSPLTEFADRVPASLRRVGGFLRREEIAVQNLRDCYLQQRELTNAQYWAIVRGFLALPLARRPGAAAILFFHDPMGEARLAEAGMRPRIYASDRSRWSRVLGNEADRPVTGLSFYQAHAVAKMAGQVLFGDSTCFRLPFGVELEVAALGAKPPGVLNGVVGASPVDLRKDDRIVTPLGDGIHGLDFGVREWVLDLPWPVGDAEGSHKRIVAGWMADHARHLVGATQFTGMGEALLARLESVGVVRGVTLAEPAELRDLEFGRPSREDRPLTRGVAGVVRSRYVRRDGEGFAGKPHRLLPRIGMRLTGGATFVKKVRTP